MRLINDLNLENAHNILFNQVVFIKEVNKNRIHLVINQFEWLIKIKKWEENDERLIGTKPTKKQIEQIERIIAKDLSHKKQVKDAIWIVQAVDFDDSGLMTYIDIEKSRTDNKESALNNFEKYKKVYRIVRLVRRQGSDNHDEVLLTEG